MPYANLTRTVQRQDPKRVHFTARNKGCSPSAEPGASACSCHVCLFHSQYHFLPVLSATVSLSLSSRLVPTPFVSMVCLATPESCQEFRPVNVCPWCVPRACPECRGLRPGCEISPVMTRRDRILVHTKTHLIHKGPGTSPLDLY